MALFDALMRKPGKARFWCSIRLSIGWDSRRVELPKNKAHKRQLVSLVSLRFDTALRLHRLAGACAYSSVLDEIRMNRTGAKDRRARNHVKLFWKSV